ncbi:MAG: NAD(P)-dependent oxidoreductase [Gemmatimonadota bacterium]
MTERAPAAPKRIFVTGATGVVGVHALPQLVALGHDVTAIGRSDQKRKRLESLGARATALDIFDEAATRAALEGVDVVINLATHMPSSAMKMMLPWSWRENDRVRREGSAALARAAHAASVARFMQESFAPVYEDGGDRWIDESWPMRPAPYNRTILDAERSAMHFTEQGGEGVVLRFGAFYGPDPMLRGMAEMVKRGWSPLAGSLSAYWSSIAQVDAASAVVALVSAPAGIYNVCDDTPLTRREWLGALAGAAGAKLPRPMPKLFETLGGSTMELLSRSQRMSNRKLRSATGWASKWPSAKDGLADAVRTLYSRE